MLYHCICEPAKSSRRSWLGVEPMSTRQAHRANNLGNLAAAVLALVFLHKKFVATQGEAFLPQCDCHSTGPSRESSKLTSDRPSWTTLQLWIADQELARPSSTGSAHRQHQAVCGRAAAFRPPPAQSRLQIGRLAGIERKDALMGGLPSMGKSCASKVLSD